MGCAGPAGSCAVNDVSFAVLSISVKRIYKITYVWDSLVNFCCRVNAKCRIVSRSHSASERDPDIRIQGSSIWSVIIRVINKGI